MIKRRKNAATWNASRGNQEHAYLRLSVLGVCHKLQPLANHALASMLETNRHKSQPLAHHALASMLEKIEAPLPATVGEMRDRWSGRNSGCDARQVERAQLSGKLLAQLDAASSRSRDLAPMLLKEQYHPILSSASSRTSRDLQLYCLSSKTCSHCMFYQIRVHRHVPIYNSST